MRGAWGVPRAGESRLNSPESSGAEESREGEREGSRGRRARPWAEAEARGARGSRGWSGGAVEREERERWGSGAGGEACVRVWRRAGNERERDAEEGVGLG